MDEIGLASLGGVPFRVDPDSVSWQFRMKTARHKTVGGMVVQVFGTDLGDMTVSGVFGSGDPSKGDTSGWEDQERFRAQVERWVDATISSSGAKPLRFSYPPRRWDFQVLVKGFGSPGGQAVTHETGLFNPHWTLVLGVVADSTQRVVSGIQDLYVSRLMAGVGWKQSAYNGPMTQAEVEKTLAPFGGDLEAYLAQQFNQAAGTTGSGSQPTGGGANSSGGGSAQVDAWISQAGTAMGRVFTASERDALKIMAQHESGNNPAAVNNSDSNARAGHPTKGLMQMRDDTFAAHAQPGHTNILNAVDNIISSVGYSIGRYGSLDNVPGVKAVRAGRAYVGY